MFRSLLAAAALFVLAGTPTLAADMALKAPPPPPVPSWTGCYVGAELGYGWDNSAHSFNNGAVGGTSTPKGALGGGLLGCNYQISRVVVGVEGDFEAANITNGGYVNMTDGTSSGSANLTTDGSVRGRLGLVVWDRSLLYATAGWAAAHYNLMGGPGFGFGVPVPCCGFSSNPNGWTVGAGWEYAFVPNWTIRVEYRHSDFGSSSGPLNPSFPTVIMSVSNKVDAVHVGVTYKFTSLFNH